MGQIPHESGTHASSVDEGSPGAVASDASATRWHALLVRLGLKGEPHLNMRGRRVRAILPAARQDLDLRLERTTDPRRREHLIAARALLDEANSALSRRHVNDAWAAYHAARRQEIRAMDDTELTAQAAALRQEVGERYAGWRAKAIAELLGNDESESPLAERAALASALRDDGVEADYLRAEQLRNQLVLIGIVATVVLAALASLLLAGVVPWGEEVPNDRFAILGVILFGALGGAFSGTISLIKGSSIERPIRAVMITGWTTVLRPVIGAVAGLAAYAFLAAGVAGLEVSGGGAYALAFAAGFSERLVSQFAESIATSGNKPDSG